MLQVRRNMTKFRTVRQNGKKQVIPINEGKTTHVSREIPSNQVNKMGIRNPGSLTDLGYRMKEPWPERKEAINAAIKKYGKKKTALKFSDLVRMNAHRPKLKEIALHDLRYVTREN